MHYPINEIFQTIQGEGIFTGLPAIFVRLQGCPVGCPWCDTRHTWVVDPAREVGKEAVLDRSNESDCWSQLSTTQIIKSFTDLGYQARHVVITGGEPCLDLPGSRQPCWRRVIRCRLKPVAPARSRPMSRPG